MGATTSQITSPTIVYSTVYSDADQIKHESSASLAFVWGNHRGPLNSPHKWPVTRKMFPFHDVIMSYLFALTLRHYKSDGNLMWIDIKLSGLNAIAINTSLMKTYISIYFASIMTSSNGIIFHVNVPLWGESTGHWWIPLTEGRWRGLLILLLLLIWTNCWTYTRRLTDNSRSDGGHLTSL